MLQAELLSIWLSELDYLITSMVTSGETTADTNLPTKHICSDKYITHRKIRKLKK